MQERLVRAGRKTLMSVALALIAMLIELGLGYPERLLRTIGHPVSWIGAPDRCARPPAQPRDRRARGRGERPGLSRSVVVLAIVGTIAFLVEHALLRLPFGILVVAASSPAR